MSKFVKLFRVARSSNVGIRSQIRQMESGKVRSTFCSLRPSQMGLSWPSIQGLGIASRRASTMSGSDVTVSRFPVPEIDSLPKDVQERIKEVEEKGGFIPNVFKALAYRPDEFRAFFTYYDALMVQDNSSLTKAEKEMIVVATSAANNCTYCVVAHGALLRIYAKNPLLGDQVAVCWEHADLSEREQMILEFAATVGEGQPFRDDLINEMIDFGFTMDDIWDIGAIAAFFAMSNRLAHLSKMRPNDEFYTLGRIPKEKKKE